MKLDERTCVGASLLFVVLCIGSLLLGFSGDCCLDDVTSSHSLKLGVGTLDLDFSSEFFVASLSCARGFDLCNVDISVESGLASREGCFGLSLLGISLGLLDCCLGVDLGDFTVLSSLAVCFSDVT